MLATEHLCWPPDIYCGHWIDGQILADGGTLGKRKPWDSGKFGWSRFDQDVVGVRRWRVRCGLPTIRELAAQYPLSLHKPGEKLWLDGVVADPGDATIGADRR